LAPCFQKAYTRAGSEDDDTPLSVGTRQIGMDLIRMKRLMLVRHGETDWNTERRLQGHADIRLSERGRAQAQALRPTVHALCPDRVVTSSLYRARDTAALLGYPEAESRDELREIHVGDWTGKSTRISSSETRQATGGGGSDPILLREARHGCISRGAPLVSFRTFSPGRTTGSCSSRTAGSFVRFSKACSLSLRTG
jgi:hypothetical protein